MCVSTLVCGDHLLFPGLELTEACVSLCVYSSGGLLPPDYKKD